MAIPADPFAPFASYAHPERLVSASWLSARLGTPGLKVVESDEDSLLYDIGHIPGSVRIDWHKDLNDPIQRDYISAEAFAELMSSKGISPDDTVVIYGDKSNWWAAFTLWVFELFGHQDVRLLNGGRDVWMAEERETSFAVPEYPRTNYPVPTRDEVPLRASHSDVTQGLGQVNLIDVRTPEEYEGARTNMENYPEEGAIRAGHIPTAVNVPWNQTVYVGGQFRSREDLEKLYADFDPKADTIVYCRIGDRSAHTWFVLKYLLGFDNVRNYDGSWVEWGNMIRQPIAVGPEPGTV
ncbi:sulfurtransferase [Corynebacterium aquilae]|uniref:Sulfurtransferase n=1 Tax=Corynebacterium aquilae DSM 44791 TaxID=1431546 RepID=A0A1L7CE57_9CORY|nr:sulfurtransferase [Corynebacterium aquilae]APT84152.1 thiosulfate sulfurtransferase [Corynebacterium aquilae DSM 44791]